MSNAIRWSPERLAEYRRQMEHRTSTSKLQRRDDARKRFQALGRLPKDRMNKTEAAYAQLLDEQQRTGQIVDYRFHPMNVRLAEHTFYEVDFLVLTASMMLEIHEVKGGYTTEKGNMKIKLCAEALPWFRFLKVSKLPKRDGGGWKFEDY
jgi:hypothetical protein